MDIRTGAFLLFFLITIKSIQAQNLPPLGQIGSQGIVSSELIYALDNKPTSECHASTLLETKDGVMCAFFAGTEERADDVGIRLSFYRNGEWSWPVEIVNGYVNDTLRYPTWNPVLFRPKNGPIYLFYKIGPSPDTWWGAFTISKDEGKSWSKPQIMGKNEIVGDLLGPIRSKPVQLKDGTIISPTSIERMGTSNGRDWRVYFEISKDNAKSWQVIPPINDGEEFDAIQPTVLVHKNGKIQILARSMQDVLVTSWSSDKGQTWTPLEKTSLPNPNAGADVVNLKDGRFLLVYNHSTRKGPEPKDRNILNVAISEDGINWATTATLENVPIPDGYSYPAAIQTEDGKVHISYTYNRRSIKHVVIDPSKI